MRKVHGAIAGVGNYASSLVQGIYYWSNGRVSSCDPTQPQDLPSGEHMNPVGVQI